MNLWRAAAAIGLALVVGMPLLQPFSRLRDAAAWQWSTDDLERIGRLAANTFLLAGGTVLLAVPAGTLLAVLLFSQRRWAASHRRVLLLALLVVVALRPAAGDRAQAGKAPSARAASLPIALWRSGPTRPWATGWGPAIWVHAAAAVPWVVTCIVGLGLRWVEPELEEEAALQLPPWRVVLFVTLPRCRASIVAAALFVGLQTGQRDQRHGHDADFHALAEEVYTQWTFGEAALGRTLLLSAARIAGTGSLLLSLVGQQGWSVRCTSVAVAAAARRRIAARDAWSWPWLVFVAFTVALLLLPTAGLFLRSWASAGTTGRKCRTWSPAWTPGTSSASVTPAARRRPRKCVRS